MLSVRIDGNTGVTSTHSETITDGSESQGQNHGQAWPWFDGDWYELGFPSSSRTLGEALVSHSIGHTRLSLVCGLLEFLSMVSD